MISTVLPACCTSVNSASANNVSSVQIRNVRMHLFQCGNNFGVLMEDLTGDGDGVELIQGL